MQFSLSVGYQYVHILAICSLQSTVYYYQFVGLFVYATMSSVCRERTITNTSKRSQSRRPQRVGQLTQLPQQQTHSVPPQAGCCLAWCWWCNSRGKCAAIPRQLCLQGATGSISYRQNVMLLNVIRRLQTFRLTRAKLLGGPILLFILGKIFKSDFNTFCFVYMDIIILTIIGQR